MTGGQEILHLLQVCLISLLLPINLGRTKSPNMIYASQLEECWERSRIPYLLGCSCGLSCFLGEKKAKL